MGILEDIGEATINLGNRLADVVLGVLIKAVKLGDRGLRVLKRVSFYPPFENKGVEYRDYVILKTQVATLMFLVSAVAHIFTSISPKFLALVLVLAGGGSLYLIFTEIKENIPRDFNAYRDFFLSYLGISLLLILVKRWKPTVDFAFPFAHLFFLAVLGIGLLSWAFKRTYGRDYTIGRVIKAGDRIKVKVNYDLRASVKPGVYTFDNITGAWEGELVKLRVEDSLFNLRGKKPVGILREENG